MDVPCRHCRVAGRDCRRHRRRERHPQEDCRHLRPQGAWPATTYPSAEATQAAAADAAKSDGMAIVDQQTEDANVATIGRIQGSSMRSPWKFACITLIAMIALGTDWARQGRADEAASADSAAAFIQRLGDRAVQIFASGAETGNEHQRVEAIEQIVLENVDLERIGRFVLGPHWEQMTSAQKERYAKVFRDYVLIVTARRLSIYRFVRFRITASQPLQGDDALVETLIEQPGRPQTTVGWRLHEEAGRFRIVDVAVEGVSMALTQRQEFAAVIGQKGVDGLLGLLEAKVAEFRAEAGQG
jgi:phospholipid transport system substrate-binding protein